LGLRSTRAATVRQRRVFRRSRVPEPSDRISLRAQRSARGRADVRFDRLHPALLGAVAAPIVAHLIAPIAFAACPNPATSSCTIAPGTTITVSTANGAGINAQNSGTVVTADGVTDNIGAAGATAVFVQGGAFVS